MESRLAVALGGQVEVGAQPSAVGIVAAAASGPLGDDTSGAVLATPESTEARDESPNGFDEMAESAFRAEARVRGELPAAPRAAEESTEETERAPLPPLDDLVKRIPENVRETLDELFRARFVRVQRVPTRALK